ncbi:MAG: PD40 domain-containing protein, partial [Bacteroidaceae bacterium]|nr:PD40 domain-containing protein [Bacteroidaceae bacterium]
MRNAFLLLISLLASCAGNPGPACEQSQSLPPITPDYCNIVMPANMVLPSFMIPGATHIRAEVQTDGTTITLDADNEILLPNSLKEYTPQSQQEPTHNPQQKPTHNPQQAQSPLTITVTVSAWSDAHPDGIRYAPFTITLSPDTISRYLTYRLIPPGYEGWCTMGIYRRDLTTYDESPIVQIGEPGDGCVNCHTSSWGDANRTLYHIRGNNGGTVFNIDGKERKVNLKELGLQGSYPAWHPSGRYVAFANTDTHQGFYTASRDKIEVYDLGGKMFIYDLERNIELYDTRFNDTTLWHTFPTFSPDGKTLYFCRAQAVQMPHQVDSLHYTLIATDFDPATATLFRQCF